MRTRKFKKARSPRRVFLVICEGETEEAYVNALKHYFRLPIAIKTKVSGNAINQRLVDKYVQELGVSSKDDYEIFYIYDSDVGVIVDRLLNLPEGKAILSNPCIEVWYLLHVKNHTRARNSKEIVGDLIASDQIWKSYNKGFLRKEQLNYLMANHESAIARGKKLKFGENPSTNMHLFLETLKSEIP